MYDPCLVWVLASEYYPPYDSGNMPSFKRRRVKYPSIFLGPPIDF